MVIPFQLFLEPLLHVNIVSLQLFQFLGDPFVKIADGQPEFVASGIVIERDRGIILHGSFGNRR